jgi:hypothetical protein
MALLMLGESRSNYAKKILHLLGFRINRSLISSGRISWFIASSISFKEIEGYIGRRYVSVNDEVDPTGLFNSLGENELAFCVKYS